MVAVRFLVSAAGAINADAGEVIELPESDARKWCDGVRAERVESTTRTRERAVKTGRETR